MSHDRSPLSELDQLLSGLLDGQLTDEQHSRLQDILRDDAAARENYRMIMLLDAELSDQFGVGADLPVTYPRAQFAVSRLSLRSWGWVAQVALAASILVAVLLWQPWRDRSHPPQVAQPGSTPPSPPAMVTRLIDARWGSEQAQLQVGDVLAEQWINLQRGILQLEFGSGARLSLKGPARLRIDGTNECFVEFGKLAVLAPPKAANFKVRSPGAEVLDLGTEFGLQVGRDGAIDLHVLDGEVALTAKGKSVSNKKTLLEHEAASVPVGQHEILDTPFQPEMFIALRDSTLRDTQPLRIQFDCGSQAGVYQGVNSPAHAAGELHAQERFWNMLIGDQAGRFLAADGRPLPYEIELDFGRHENKRFDWDAEPMTDRAPEGRSLGVFHTPLGEDNLAARGKLAFRLRGLPPGRYRVYVLGRSTLQHPVRGNLLVEKAHMAAVAVNIPDVDAAQMPLEMAPLEDPNAGKWIDGQTHVVAEVSITHREDYLTIIAREDQLKSRVKSSPSVILGFQIVQTDGGPHVDRSK
jgi:ferric-dicitrate binding protein FerR (iron transport regulator)